ncbi:ABC transporter permease [Thioclava nitratireducens]|uniref:ABC transporter permease n=1 Tax=Thioclava nitratireducens TaxID=1915078 RepID=UPI0024807CEC|nr:ABC transporter permease [Thioclava nitratireducens]WGT50498.1 ABC transporter permease [Thioclava nitratireducens]
MRVRGVNAGLSPPGVLFALLGLAAIFTPFLTLAANRIVAGEGRALWTVAAPQVTGPGIALMLLGLAFGLPAARPYLRIAGAALGLAGLVWLLIAGASFLLNEAGEYARVSPAAGFWFLLVVFALMMADALSALSPGPAARAGILGLVIALVAALLWSGALSDLSIAQEFASRKDAFYTASLRHLGLAFGSLLAAAVIGLPLGVMCHRNAALRGALLPVLSFLQTIPSLAMFGLMIPVLSWLSGIIPGARAIGIAGIGFAPAFLALTLYSLLPVVANVLAGLRSAPASALEAARGMGMTWRQRLARVELPLGLPVVLAGLRIVLVQNIGLAVIAGLIGGGGYGTFVFQGLNQTAGDLILLGALPTVALALVSAIAMDILVELTTPRTEREE